jgi:hypothetical protein
MRRLYVAPEAVHLAHKDIFHPRIGSHCVQLKTYTNPEDAELQQSDPVAWEALPEVIAWRAAGSPLLISTTFTDHGESQETRWHSHPDVGILPNPVFEGTMSLSDCADCPEHKFEQHHLEHLVHIGVVPTDTVLHVSDKAKVFHRDVKLSPID